MPRDVEMKQCKPLLDYVHCNNCKWPLPCDFIVQRVAYSKKTPRAYKKWGKGCIEIANSLWGVRLTPKWHGGQTIFNPNLKAFAELIKSDYTNLRDQPNDTKNNKFEDGLCFIWSLKVLGYLAIPYRGLFPKAWLPTWGSRVLGCRWSKIHLRQVAWKMSWSCTCYELYCGRLDLHIFHFTYSPKFL